uniref:RRM domain-containing protein n=1 Tax=Chromera velia CCMP2878 TaxID=1169474 RepID=A0A0G4F6C0_9ALVE|eukprot:Cvel_15286.t1-p1 / transcript=Cvel_15286.t1 / gene=Cvel_15286 / organism=Chromera_velia_CCMP2878 / gene_product=hypothetical protein / transcript_product=hypothetical protein / location=Cvel_scaffold1121:45400-46253(+) / protein_length=226 / sequence_SO=supercontig / SO=protein_coding / is_pseudo=false
MPTVRGRIQRAGTCLALACATFAVAIPCVLAWAVMHAVTPHRLPAEEEQVLGAEEGTFVGPLLAEQPPGDLGVLGEGDEGELSGAALPLGARGIEVQAGDGEGPSVPLEDRKIVLKNLPRGLRESNLQVLAVEAVGEDFFESAELKTHRRTGESRQFGFIILTDRVAAERAVRKLDGRILEERRVTAEISNRATISKGGEIPPCSGLRRTLMFLFHDFHQVPTKTD